MEICIVGAGVVGKATGKGFLHHGHNVVFYDENPDMVERLKEEFLDARDSLKGIDCDIYFICLPEKAVEKGIQEILPRKGLIVIRSTTVPNTTKALSLTYGVHICHNPEFLRERYAEEDFLYPRRIVIGECCPRHGALLEKLYSPFNSTIIHTDATTSELAKLACNAFLSTSISFWNEIGEIARREEVKFKDISKIASLDSRIPRYGARYLGKYSGRCLPKDIDSLIRLCEEQGTLPLVLRAVRERNHLTMDTYFYEEKGEE